MPEDGLRDCQIKDIQNIEKSFKDNKPKALIQMATGSGKTFTAIIFIYRLLKYTKSKTYFVFGILQEFGRTHREEDDGLYGL